jgi:hypothetical protein
MNTEQTDIRQDFIQSTSSYNGGKTSIQAGHSRLLEHYSRRRSFCLD